VSEGGGKINLGTRRGLRREKDGKIRTSRPGGQRESEGGKSGGRSRGVMPQLSSLGEEVEPVVRGQFKGLGTQERERRM